MNIIVRWLLLFQRMLPLIQYLRQHRSVICTVSVHALSAFRCPNVLHDSSSVDTDIISTNSNAYIVVSSIFVRRRKLPICMCQSILLQEMYVWMSFVICYVVDLHWVSRFTLIQSHDLSIISTIFNCRLINSLFVCRQNTHTKRKKRSASMSINIFRIVIGHRLSTFAVPDIRQLLKHSTLSVFFRW